METFAQTFGFVAAITAGIIILAVFFSVLGYVKRVCGGPTVLKVKGLLNDGRLLNVHLNNGKILEAVKFIGFADPNSPKGAGLPYQFANMLIVENASGSRLLIRAETVRMLEEITQQ
jgi:hypothetical protein